LKAISKHLAFINVVNLITFDTNQASVADLIDTAFNFVVTDCGRHDFRRSTLIAKTVAAVFKADRFKPSEWNSWIFVHFKRDLIAVEIIDKLGMIDESIYFVNGAIFPLKQIFPVEYC
jgi:hypothetical protein